MTKVIREIISVSLVLIEIFVNYAEHEVVDCQ